MKFTGDEIFIDGVKEKKQTDIFFYAKTTGKDYFIRMSKNATAKDAYLKALGSVDINDKIERVSKISSAFIHM